MWRRPLLQKELSDIDVPFLRAELSLWQDPLTRTQAQAEPGAYTRLTARPSDDYPRVYPCLGIMETGVPVGCPLPVERCGRVLPLEVGT